MNIIDFALSKARVFVGILVFIIASGAATYVSIPKESTPDVNIPIIYVSLSQTGISAEDSERLLVKPIEDEVKSVEGIKEVRSTAYSGGGNVLLEFDASLNPIEFANCLVLRVSSGYIEVHIVNPANPPAAKTGNPKLVLYVSYDEK